MSNGSFKSFSGIIFDLAYTVVEYRDASWPEIWDRGLQAAYGKLTDRISVVGEYADFKRRFDEVKESHRRRAAKTLAGWQIRDVLVELFSEMTLTLPEADIDAFLETFYAPARNLMYLEDGTAKTLRHLKQTGFRLGIISNTVYPAALHSADLSSLGLDRLFDVEIYSSSQAHRKPHPSIFHTAAERIGLPPGEIVYVGDRYDADVLGAQKVGMRAVLKLCGRQTYPDPLPAGLPVIDAIRELPVTLRTIGHDGKKTSLRP